jgi:hypothetical protein
VEPPGWEIPLSVGTIVRCTRLRFRRRVTVTRGLGDGGQFGGSAANPRSGELRDIGLPCDRDIGLPCDRDIGLPCDRDIGLPCDRDADAGRPLHRPRG